MDVNDPDFIYLGVDRKALMKQYGDSFDSKKNCWVPDDKEVFVAATIEDASGDMVTVRTVEKCEVSSLDLMKFFLNNHVIITRRRL